jgi:hypothetical protein
MTLHHAATCRKIMEGHRCHTVSPLAYFPFLRTKSVELLSISLINLSEEACVKSNLIYKQNHQIMHFLLITNYFPTCVSASNVAIIRG